MDRDDLGLSRCDGMLGSGSGDDTKVTVGTSAELDG